MLKDNIIRLCKENKISISKLEDNLNIGRSSISRWDKATPRIDTVVKVADYFGVTVDYLLSDTTDTATPTLQPERRSGRGRRQSDYDAKLILQELSTIIKNYGGEQLSPETRKIAVVGTIKCGNNGVVYEDSSEYLMIDDSLHGELFALHTKGSSMVNEGINDGDLAIIRKQDDINSGEIAAVLIDNDEATLKRVVKIDGGVALEGANPAYKTRYFMGENANQIKILGKLVEIRKRY